MEMHVKPVEVLIIGGGPIGMACGIACQEAGLDYLILEKGCLVNSLYHYPSTMTFFSTSERLEIGDVPFVSNLAKPTRSEALEYYRRVALHKKLRINLFEEAGDVIRTSEDHYLISTSKAVYKASNIIIATGFYDIPQLLDVPGEDLPKVSHYYKDPHFYALQNVLVVGANNSSVDAALETWRKGARVTMVVRGDEIGRRVKYWVKPDIENRIKEGEIRAFFNSEILEIRPDSVLLRTPEGDLEIENDWVLAMTGYQPNLAFLKKTGINLSPDEIMKPEYMEDSMETNLPHVYLAGVVCGGMDTHSLFIENSRVHASRIVDHILSKSKERLDAESAA